METGRRDFLATVALGTLGAAGLGLADPNELAAQQAAGHWDLGWTGKLRGKYRAVFDVPNIEEGYGIWRAVIWRQQASQVYGVNEAGLATVVVLRGDAISLALTQEFWLSYDAGLRWAVRDPATGEPSRRNPVVDRTGTYALPVQFSGFTLESLLEGGAVVLGCALALRECAALVAERDQVSMDEADRRVRRMLVPGVILQPSGVFAAVLAQDYGCRYVRAT